MNKTSNPKLYRKLSEPFAGRDMANAALEAFAKDFEAIREKHKIADVVAVIEVGIMEASGEEYQAIVLTGFGDAMRRPTLLAYALGKVQAEQQQAIGALLKYK